ncbi:SWPV1-019 [Shearwaterpox virus]|uniref:SWPV1-019 n=1 Tax=Shearwaterpox virus TaxID=1974596 RepID=A0A1V0S7N5_CNPV|nr:SWPV1-019 [Shearwaterpox virus]
MHYIYVCEAIMENDDASLKRFLDDGFNPNIEYGIQFPLEIAVAFRNEEAIKMLIRYGAKPSPKICSNSSLHEAVLKDDYLMMKELLDKKAYVNNVLYFGAFTPLCLAVYHNKTNLVKLLLKYSADVNIPNIELSTPLHLAVRAKNIKIVKLLVNNEADIDIEDDYGNTPLTLAVESGNHEICNILLKKRIIKNNGLKSLLMIAAVNGNRDIVRMLVESGENVNLPFEFNSKSYTVLEAIKDNNPEMLSTEAVAELVAAVVISKCKYMSEDEEIGFSKNASVILETDSLIKVAMMCGEEFLNMEKIQIGKRNLYEICILKQNKHLDVTLLLNHYRKIINLYTQLQFYKHSMKRVIQLMSIRRSKLHKALTVTDDTLKSNPNWSVVPMEIKYIILGKMGNRELKKLIQIH